MPVNKDAYARYRLIDERLRRPLGAPTLDDLIRYVSDKLGKTVAKRTIQQDLQNMRWNEELGFKAPIVYDRREKVYRYQDSGYSIFRLPVHEYDLQGLEIAIGILKQFSSLPFIKEFEEAILRIADSLKINRQMITSNSTLLEIDHPPAGGYKGAKWIDHLAEGILARKLVRLSYQSYQRNTPKEYLIAPYHIREYQHRFYVIGNSVKEQPPKIRTFALDRIVDIWPTNKSFEVSEDFDHQALFQHVIGISDPEKSPEHIELWFTPQQAKYVLGQPIHASQTLIEETPEGSRIGLEVVINHELVMLLLSYGANVKVLSPSHLAERIRAEAERMLARYGAAG